MTRRLTPILNATITLILITTTGILLHAQTPTATNRNLIFLDPAHGGPDTGAQFPNHVLEKDITLAFATQLRTALTSASFTVTTPRDIDPTAVLPTDTRASLANHARPAACILLHATPSGSGVHIFTSTLPSTAEPKPWQPIPWDTAQSGYITPSHDLADLLASAILQAKIPVILSHASIPPLDNLTCPAVALEIAPLAAGDSTTPVTDAPYQQRIASAIATAMQQWRTQNAPTHPAAGTGATP